MGNKHPDFSLIGEAPDRIKELAETCPLWARHLEGRERVLVHGVQDYSEETPTPGPGATLTRILKAIGIKPTAKCGCESKAAMMDAYGKEWCINNREMLVGWLREEAERAGLPFWEVGANLLLGVSLA